MSDGPATSEDIYALLAPRENLLQVFYHLLWQKTGSARGVTHNLCGVNLPDTIVLNHSRCIAWYFTSKDGTIRRKSRKNLSSTQIIEQISKRKPSCSGASAVLISKDTGNEEGVTFTPAMATKDAPKQHNLRSMLAEDLLHGTLQAFIEPKKESGIYTNHVIVANWTPNVFYFEKRANIINMESERQHSLSDRTTISETARQVRVVPLVSSRTTNQIEGICASIAQHIDALHGCRVSNLVLHFKIDENDVPWVMYCSTIRASKPNDARGAVSLTLVPVNEALSSALVPHKQANNKNPAALAIARKKRRQVEGLLLGDDEEDEGEEQDLCSLCRQMLAASSLTLVAQKHVLFPLAIVEFFGTHAPGTPFQEIEVDGEVPPHVMLLHENMTTIDYETMKTDPHWKDFPVKLCRGCAAGLESITASIQIDFDGFIRVPDRHSASPFLQHVVSASAKTTHFRPSKLRTKMAGDKALADDLMRQDPSPSEPPIWETIQTTVSNAVGGSGAPQQQQQGRATSQGSTNATTATKGPAPAAATTTSTAPPAPANKPPGASGQKAKALADKQAQQRMMDRERAEQNKYEPSTGSNKPKPRRF